MINDQFPLSIQADDISTNLTKLLPNKQIGQVPELCISIYFKAFDTVHTPQKFYINIGMYFS